jgi:tRNA G10  N-methylase Trm11
MIITATKGTNADLFPSVLSIYVPEGSVVADVTYGRGVFWQKVDRSKYDLRATDLQDGTDARKLPYADESLDALVFDPPYMHWSGSIKESINGCYKNNERGESAKSWQDVLKLYTDAAIEARRVLKPSGVFICKVQDTVACGKQRWFHVHVMQLEGFHCEDIFVLMQNGIPTHDPKWKKQYHARKNHSYFIVLRKLK